MLYIQVPMLAGYAERELQDFEALRPARHLGESCRPAEADTMLAAVARLRWDNRNMRGASRGLLRNIKLNGIEVTPEQQRRILGGLKAHFQGCVVTPAVPLTDPNDNTRFLQRRLTPR